MDDTRTGILNGSNRFISKLQLLSVFFENDLIFQIYIRTQVIHTFFEGNKELDINKLELFHLQFTETIINLLKKIKKNNETNISLTENEIGLNEDVINRISRSMRLEEDFGRAQKAQADLINQSLFKLYQNLSDLSANAPFPKNIGQFSATFAPDFFHEIEVEKAESLINFDPVKMYSNNHGMIEKRLMGLQCKYNFRNTFYCGVKAGGIVLELYKVNTEKEAYFLFYPAEKRFLSFPFSAIEGIDLSANISKKAKIIQELTSKNNKLKSSINITKTNIPPEVMQLLSDYYNKISSMDSFHFLNEFDVQANILKTMLNTDGL